MAKITEKLVIALVKGLGSLSFRATYFLSDLIYRILFKLIGYRRKVVMNNLRNSFPEKSEAAIRKIANSFYRYLSDLIMESLKMYSITEQELRKRMLLEGHEQLNELYDQGKSILIVCAHYGNYEFGAIRYTLDARHRVNTVYKQLSSPVFDRFLRTSRSRFGTFLVPTRKFRQVLEEEKKEGILSASGLVSDQTPSAMKGYWMEFLHQDTPVFMSCEQLAIAHDMPVVYGEVDRIRRGHYILKFSILFAEPRNTEPGEITETFTKIIEKSIRRKPELWLWSHKRWKKKAPASLPDNQFSRKYPISTIRN